MRTYAFLLAFFLALVTILTLFGCERAQEIDNWIWDKTPGPETVPGPDPAPPILELVASIAALLGYGGMATWIHRSGKNGRQKTEAIAFDLADLAAAVAKLEKSIGPPA